MSDVFAWASVGMAAAVAITLGMSVSANFQRAALIQGALALTFLGAYALLVYFPPTA